MTRTLGVFAKQPLPGRVKTRLAAARSPAWAAEVSEAFLLDLLDQLQTLTVRRVLAYDPPEALAYFQQAAGQRFDLVPQGEGDLGDRLARFVTREFDAGARAVVVVGTDSPTLPITLVAQAYAELARADVVLGPAADGGYYLIGCSRPLPFLFAGIDWGTPRVLEQTVGRLAPYALRLALLTPWYDVDTLDAWHALRGHIAALRAAGLDPRVPRTEALLWRE
jgi:rSAM/selenodomain-associated transferase 1